MDGLLVIDKPPGPTSHDVVARVRRATGERRIGHTGTLDPSASGVLPLVLGRATRLARFLSSRDKAYDAVVRLGVATDTYDAAGAPLGAASAGPPPSRGEVEHALDAFRGTFPQQPPRHSAKKIGGKRSYRLARAHARTREPLEPLAPPAFPAPVTVTAYAIHLIECDGWDVTLRLECSAGFYVRSLAHDLGDRLGVGAHLQALRRTRSGDQTLADALPLDVVEREPERARAALVPLSRMLVALPAVVLTPEGMWRAGHGRDLGPGHLVRETAQVAAGGLPPLCIRMLGPEGDLVGIAEPAGTPEFLHPSVVLM